MDDLISRQAAIDALMVRDKELRNINWYDKPYAEGECRGIDEALAIVSNLPSAQPQRTGRWLPDNNSVYEMRFICSECKESQVVPTIGFTKYKPIWDFCPNCGAKMEAET